MVALTLSPSPCRSEWTETARPPDEVRREPSRGALAEQRPPGPQGRRDLAGSARLADARRASRAEPQHLIAGGLLEHEEHLGADEVRDQQRDHRGELDVRRL